MTIKDDIKAINKDIFEAKDWDFKPLRDRNIIFIDYKVKGVY